jgi:hypothetical protein
MVYQVPRDVITSKRLPPGQQAPEVNLAAAAAAAHVEMAGRLLPQAFGGGVGRGLARLR